MARELKFILSTTDIHALLLNYGSFSLTLTTISMEMTKKKPPTTQPEISPTPFSSSAEREELERALYNLISNAVRYAKSSIELKINHESIWIKDDGPGLLGSLEDLAQPFNARAFKIAGEDYTSGTAGLGLYIARRIIEAHGGELSLAENSDKGATFRVRLRRHLTSF